VVKLIDFCIGFFVSAWYNVGIDLKKGEYIIMKKYVCEPCGYIYDPEVGDPDNGIPAGTAFEDLPEDWVCPICGMDKSVFVEED